MEEIDERSKRAGVSMLSVPELHAAIREGLEMKQLLLWEAGKETSDI